MKDLKTLREAVRAILSEAWGHDDGLPDEADRSRVKLGKKDVVFPVSLPDKRIVMVHATYDESRPFDVEVWGAQDETGADVDVDDLRMAIPNLDDRAWEAVENDYR